MPKPRIQLDIGENYYDPAEFVEACVYADELGFDTGWLGDHFNPWYHSADRSAFVWSVLGVALDRTQKIKLGPFVTTPIGARYHPALVAQASATLDNMYPGRFLLGVGTGEALNETPFWNGRWPPWEERIERLSEGMTLIQKLWTETEHFAFEGKYFGAPFYQLYTRPKTKIPVYFSAIGKRAAYYAGLHADYLVTLSPRNNLEKLKNDLLPAFRKGNKESGRKKKGGLVVSVGYTFESPSEVIRTSWRSLGIMIKDSWSTPNPISVEENGKKVTADIVKQNLHFCKGWTDLITIIDQYVQLGADQIVLNSGADKKVIKEFAKNVLSVF